VYEFTKTGGAEYTTPIVTLLYVVLEQVDGMYLSGHDELEEWIDVDLYRELSNGKEFDVARFRDTLAARKVLFEHKKYENTFVSPTLSVNWIDPGAYVRVCVDNDSEDMLFELPITSDMQPVFDEFAKTKGVDVDAVRFVHTSSAYEVWAGDKAGELASDDRAPICEVHVTSVLAGPNISLRICCLDGTSVQCNVPSNSLVHGIHNVIAKSRGMPTTASAFTGTCMEFFLAENENALKMDSQIDEFGIGDGSDVFVLQYDVFEVTVIQEPYYMQSSRRAGEGGKKFQGLRGQEETFLIRTTENMNRFFEDYSNHMGRDRSMFEFETAECPRRILDGDLSAALCGIADHSRIRVRPKTLVLRVKDQTGEQTYFKLRIGTKLDR
jgi:hypothetical protein